MRSLSQLCTQEIRGIWRNTSFWTFPWVEEALIPQWPPSMTLRWEENEDLLPSLMLLFLFPFCSMRDDTFSHYLSPFGFSFLVLANKVSQLMLILLVLGNLILFLLQSIILSQYFSQFLVTFAYSFYSFSLSLPQFFVLFCFGTIPEDTPGFLPALCSVIIPSQVQDTK